MSKETTQLRVRPLPPPPEKQRITFRLPVPTIAVFKKYLAVYAEIYGTKADPDFVANQIFTTFFESDRAFSAYVKSTAAAGVSSSGGGAEGEEPPAIEK